MYDEPLIHVVPLDPHVFLCVFAVVLWNDLPAAQPVVFFLFIYISFCICICEEVA
jgi:hypothetical protein